jgi:hypothetical protein
MRFLGDFLLASNKQGHGAGGLGEGKGKFEPRIARIPRIEAREKTWPAKHAKIREKTLNQEQAQGAKTDKPAACSRNSTQRRQEAKTQSGQGKS